MRRVFNDERLNEEFIKNGYVCVPFISSDEVAELKQRIGEMFPKELETPTPTLKRTRKSSWKVRNVR
jgi:hypothetical protein